MNIASSDSQIHKPPCGRPNRDELPDVNINTGAQSIDAQRTSLNKLREIHVSKFSEASNASGEI